MEFLADANCVCAILSFSDDAELSSAFDNGLESFSQKFVVVDKENALRHGTPFHSIGSLNPGVLKSNTTFGARRMTTERYHPNGAKSRTSKVVAHSRPCDGISREEYHLWTLGLLEGPEAELIRTHLSDGCQSCTEEIRASLEFWALFGATAGLDQDSAPSPRVRARLLESIASGHAPAPKVLPLRRLWRYLSVAALAASLLIVASIGWQQFGRHREEPASSRPVPANPELNAVTSRISDLQQKLSDSERQIERLKRSSPIIPAAGSVRPDAAQESTFELEKALAEANQQIQQLRAALSGEQAKSARLAQEFDQQAAAMATLSRERRDAEANLAAANGRLAEHDRQIKALDAKIVQLEHERDRLNDALNNQKIHIQHTTRLVAFLSNPGVKIVRLAGTEAAPGATGYALLSEGKRMIFTGSNLPALRGGKVYQLWLMRGKSPGIVSAGIFQGSGDQATIDFGNASLLNDVRGLAVTDEPAGGSPLPTGHKLLIGTVKS
jgi:hypothetical protein